jgi:hypothetical protein
MPMDVDRVVASRPANKTAAVVTGKGVHWEPAKKLIRPWDAWQDTPLPVFQLPPKDARIPAGLKVGRLTVIGYGGAGANGGCWVVRCTCGMYGHKKARALRSEFHAPRAMCPRCDYLEQLKAGHIPPVPLRSADRQPST